MSGSIDMRLINDQCTTSNAFRKVVDQVQDIGPRKKGSMC
jgi:hypothetical protein